MRCAGDENSSSPEHKSGTATAQGTVPAMSSAACHPFAERKPFVISFRRHLPELVRMCASGESDCCGARSACCNLQVVHTI